MTNPIFGEPWDSPLCEGAARVATPVGRKCLFCETPVEDGDRGILMGCGRTAEDGGICHSTEPEHRECLARAVAGSPAHLAGTCPCRTGRGPDPWEHDPARRRAEALEVWKLLHPDETGAD